MLFWSYYFSNKTFHWKVCCWVFHYFLEFKYSTRVQMTFPDEGVWWSELNAWWIDTVKQLLTSTWLDKWHVTWYGRRGKCLSKVPIMPMSSEDKINSTMQIKMQPCGWNILASKNWTVYKQWNEVEHFILCLCFIACLLKISTSTYFHMIKYKNHYASARSNLMSSNQNNKKPSTFALSLRACHPFSFLFEKGLYLSM